MNNLRVIVTTVFMAVACLALQVVSADAAPKSASPVVANAIFTKMIATEFSSQEIAEITDTSRRTAQYIRVKKISISKGKETFLVEGIKAPFLGNSNAMFWVYEKAPNDMKKIADIGACDGVKVLSTSHNNYKDLGSFFFRERNIIHNSIFDGEKYIAR